MELYYGAMRSQNPGESHAVQARFVGEFDSLPFDDAAARLCGELRAYLARQGIPIGPYDLQIASIALTNNLTLITHNTDEFRRVPGLLVEDWEIE